MPPFSRIVVLAPHRGLDDCVPQLMCTRELLSHPAPQASTRVDYKLLAVLSTLLRYSLSRPSAADALNLTTFLALLKLTMLLADNYPQAANERLRRL